MGVSNFLQNCWGDRIAGSVLARGQLKCNFALSQLTLCAIMNNFEIDSCVRAFHIYKETWTPSLGDEHDCQCEQGNPQDPYAVAVMHQCLGVVGHVPRLISAACSLFLRRDTSTIKCRITDL